MYRRSLIVLFFASSIAAAASLPAQANDSRLTVDRIFKNGDFATKYGPEIVWSHDGTSYYEIRPDGKDGSKIVRVSAATGSDTVLATTAELVDQSKRPIQVDELILSADESKALLYHDTERVWRQNTKGYYEVFDFNSRRVIPISRKKGLQMFAKFSPDGRSVAFVRDNNIFVTDLTNEHERQLTQDGTENIINGTSDWVYEEEFDLRDGFRWSPDGRRIAYWHFDQSNIPLFPLETDDYSYPVVRFFHYPKAGWQNSKVKLGVLDVGSGKTTWLRTDPDTTAYLPRMQWVDNEHVAYQWMPRRQNRDDYILADATSGEGRLILMEVDSAYVDVQDPIWIHGGRHFLWLSDRSGWRQLYLYERNGTLVRQLSNDGSDVLSVVGVDEASDHVYVQTAAPTPKERQIFSYKLDGSTGEQLTTAQGTHDFNIAPTGKYALDVYSAINAPPSATLYQLPSMRVARVLEDNADLKAKLAALKLHPAEFFQIPAADNSMVLDAYRIVPPGFDEMKKYPVLMYVYGGPAIPQVNDQWSGQRYLWHQMLAQHGYVVVCVDNRGAAWRGRHFRKLTQFHLGLTESDDQIAAAKWLGQQPWGDSARIGIWGWSYGGYMTLMSTTRGGGVFKMGLSVAPVTDWRLYDTVYSERFMGLPQENEAGYAIASPQTYVDGLSAKLMVVHGSVDDNVHMQNTMQFAQKLEDARKPFSMLIYPGKTHSILGFKTRLHLYDSFTRFILDNL